MPRNRENLVKVSSIRIKKNGRQRQAQTCCSIRGEHPKSQSTTSSIRCSCRALHRANRQALSLRDLWRALRPSRLAGATRGTHHTNKIVALENARIHRVRLRPKAASNITGMQVIRSLRTSSTIQLTSAIKRRGRPPGNSGRHTLTQWARPQSTKPDPKLQSAPVAP